MRLLIKQQLPFRSIPALVLFASIAFAREPQLHFAVIGPEPGAWPQVLSSVGFVQQDSDLAKVFVLRAATPASRIWADRVERGAHLILEGESPVAESFGFRGGEGASASEVS